MKFDKPNLLKVQGEPGLVRDSSSGAILAADINSKKAFLQAQKKETALEKLPALMEKINEQQKQMEELTSLVKEISKAFELLAARLNPTCLNNGNHLT